jgi:hypothetical protein
MLRQVIVLLGILTILIGLGFLGAAIATPLAYKTLTLGSVEYAQVYGEATYKAVIAIACFVFAACCILMVAQPAARRSDRLKVADTAQIVRNNEKKEVEASPWLQKQ